MGGGEMESEPQDSDKVNKQSLLVIATVRVGVSCSVTGGEKWSQLTTGQLPLLPVLPELL